jgi:hypothetical protein
MVLQYLLQIIDRETQKDKADKSTCKQQTRCAVHEENYIFMEADFS